MRLARRALLAALSTLILVSAVSAQTLRPGNDPRNQAPTVGTGGPPGGPTGLFTIYDGDTLRRGEYTFSIAYSNYDRDPGDVDLTVVPLSVNVGLNDYLELFFSTEGWRGVNVNNPKHLSSFYLPNSQLFFGNGILGSGPAIILAPIRVSGPVVGTGQVFRPALVPALGLVGGQGFVPFPFVGGTGPTLGVEGSVIAPRFVSTLGGAVGGGGGNFGAASAFPGIGSPCGSILPGVVLTTRTIPPNLTFGTLTVPELFTTCPTYLPDAPFVNRLYGESSFGTMNIGAKIRFTDPDNPLGVGIIPFYRFYLDKADDASGFNQLQRGASPGGNIGDFGLVGFVGGRLSRSVSLSANIGYILNSNPRSDALGGDAVLLDRPDELVAGVGADFVVNRHFQIITELKSVHYVAGRTPNSFPNNPVDFLGGVRIFPRRWFGFSAWYRAHLNQQGENFLDFFGDDDVNGGFPLGFRQSDDPHGFGFQFFIGRRNERLPTVFPNQPPTVTLTAASSRVVLPAVCTGDQQPDPACTPTSSSVQLSAQATDPDGDTLLYTYSTTGGRVTGDGPNATLDLTGVEPGTYTVTVEVDDGCGCIAFTSTTVTVERCGCITPAPACPTVDVSCPDTATPGQPVTFTASVSGGDPNVTPTFNWTVSAGTITSGQGTSSITVDTTGLAGGTTVTATVDVGGFDRNCTTSDSCTTSLTAPAQPRKIDEYGNIRFNDEKARLDNFAIELQNDPTAQGYIIAYGGRRGRAGEAQRRADRAKDYLVNTRGISADRIVTVDGGFREDLTVELWIVPQGATAPTASPTVDPSEVQTTAPARRRRGRRGRDDEDEE
ncbi:MAG: PKD domain-containing protein [Acidobacteriota bacterium]|nr:PKD domain-containing protein [Acidobacteriota bacterium]